MVEHMQITIPVLSKRYFGFGEMELLVMMSITPSQ